MISFLNKPIFRINIIKMKTEKESSNIPLLERVSNVETTMSKNPSNIIMLWGYFFSRISPINVAKYTKANTVNITPAALGLRRYEYLRIKFPDRNRCIGINANGNPSTRRTFIEKLEISELNSCCIT